MGAFAKTLFPGKQSTSMMEGEAISSFKPDLQISTLWAIVLMGLAGTGLGLSIAHDIVEINGGRVVLERAPLGGLGVSVFLPGALPDRARPGGVCDRTAAARRGGARPLAQLPLPRRAARGHGTFGTFLAALTGRMFRSMWRRDKRRAPSKGARTRARAGGESPAPVR